LSPHKHDIIQKEVNFEEAVSEKIKHKHPFCLTRIPGKGIELFTSYSFHALNEKRQVICKPWKSDSKSVHFFNGSGEKKIYKETGRPDVKTTLTDYKEAFTVCMNALRSGKLKKVVLSRIMDMKANGTPNLIELFKKATVKYPDAFVYLMLHPSEGYWLGASPEILLKKVGNEYESVSLAGTQPASNGNYQWREKERVEQSLVTDQIRSVLTHLNCHIKSEIGPKTIVAGKVAHLKTQFLFSCKEKMLTLLENLHPTPAVAGLPKKESIDLIDKTEKHERGLYTGYIGVYDSEKADIYVNLRCMRVASNQFHLYLGGGLTEDSELMNEWKETENKAQTLLNLINE